MRLARFRLERYGPFEQLDLPLDPTPGRVNLIVAPNGYGKSVIRHAINDFLFGIEARTPMTFRFGTERMKLHADIVHGGTVRSLVRRKGNGITLQDAGGADVSPDEAQLLRGGADQTVFRELFGLDTALLRSGGHDLIRSQGRLGQVLFAAGGGMARVRDLLGELERKRDDLGRAGHRHKSRPLWGAMSNWEQASAELRRVALRPDRWTALEREAAETAHHLRTLLSEQTEDLKRRDRLRTTSACRPWLDRLQTANRILADAQDSPELDDGFEKRWRDALRHNVVATGNAEAAAQEAQAATAARAALTFDPAWIAAAADIAALSDLRGIALQCENDLPIVGRELAAEQTKAEILRRDLGWDPSLPLPPAPIVKDAQRRLRAYPKLAAEASAAQDALATAQHTLAALLTERDSLPPRTDITALADLVSLGRAGGDPAMRLDNAQRKLREAEATARIALAAIPDCPLPEDALFTTAAPSEARLDSADRTHSQAEADFHQAVRAHAACLAERDREQTRLAVLEQTARLPPQDALAQARAARDALWNRFCAQPADAAGPTASVVLDRAIRHADTIADALIAHGQEVAQASALRNRLSTLETECAAHDTAVSRAAATLQEARATVIAIARTAGGSGDDIPGLRGFLRGREAAIAASITRDTASAELRDLGTDLQAVSIALAAAMALPRRDLAEIGTLLTEADRRIDADRDLAVRRQSLTQQAVIARLAQDTATATAAKASRGLSDWETEWAGVAALLVRPSHESPIVTAEVIGQIEELRKAEVIAADKQLRIDDMHVAVARLAAKITNLAGLSPQRAERPPIEAAALFQQQLQAEQQLAARCMDADQRAEQAEIRRAQADTEAAAAVRALAGLRAALRAETNEQAEQQLQRSRAVTAARADVKEALHQLAVQGCGLALDALTTLAEATTPETDTALTGELDTRQRDRIALIETARAAAADAATALEQAGNGLDAAEAAQRREAAQAMLSRTAEEALVLHATHALLQAALDRQASTADQPLLARIGTVFRAITGGAQAGVRVEDTKDGQTMVALEADGVTRKALDQLSEGTCDQLYLALRIAALEDYAANASPLPFIADDILQTFDDPRTIATMQVLRSLSEHVQVIVLTHHPHVGALAARLSDDAVKVITLQA